MKISSVLLGVVCSLGSSFGDETKISPETEAIDNAPVLDEAVFQHGKDTLVIQRIEQPEFLSVVQVAKVAPIAEVKELEESPLPTSTYVISATSYGEKGTKIQVWPSHTGQQEMLEGWSNVNWAYFQNLLSVEDEEMSYVFMLFHSTRPSSQTEKGVTRGNQEVVEFSEIPVDLPEFSKSGARYLVTSAEETEREETLDFLETLHELYDENHQELRQNREEAIQEHEEHKRQIKEEAKKPKTRVLRIWRHTRNETDATNK